MKTLHNSNVFSKFQMKSYKKHIPLGCNIELTNRCNERCLHCYIDDFSDDQNRTLDLDEWKSILKQLRAAGTLFISLMGGEAMLNPFFWDILKEARKLGFYINLITNGLKIKNAEVAKALKEFGLNQITFSLYSLDEKTHDYLTHTKGSHKRLMDAFRFSKNAGLRVSINTLLTRVNIEHYFDLVEWALQENVELKPDTNVTPKFSGDMGPTSLRVTSEQFRWYLVEKAKKWKNGAPKSANLSKESYVCNAAKGKCAITAYGELLACIEIREPLGSLKKQSFHEIWNAEIAKKWRNIKVKDIEGAEGVEDYCTHCPGTAQHEHQNPFRLTDYDILQAKIKKEVSEYFSDPNI